MFKNQTLEIITEYYNEQHTCFSYYANNNNNCQKLDNK